MSGGQSPNPIRAYVDTSVFGGCFDEEFAEHSRAFFERVASAEVLVLMSEITDRELALAPEQVRDFVASIAQSMMVRCEASAAVAALAEAYITAKVVSAKWLDDALHVASATIHRADVLVSWNFKHLVRIDRSRGFNAVNARLGYPPIIIASPREVQYVNREEGL